MPTIGLANPTDYARQTIQVSAVPLPDRFLLPTDADDALSARTDGGAWSWCQWWPLVSPAARALGSHGWLYPSGHLRLIRVAYPVSIPAHGEVTVEIDRVVSPTVPYQVSVWYLLRDTVFKLEDDEGQTSNIRLEGVYAQNQVHIPHNGSANARVRWFRTTRRHRVGSPLWHKVLWEAASDSRVVRFWHTVGASGPSLPRSFKLPKLSLTISPFFDVEFPYATARMPETVPTVYNAAGTAVVTPGSGTSKEVISASVGKRYYRFPIFNPSDRHELTALSGKLRGLLTAGKTIVNYGVLGYVDSQSQAVIDNFRAESIERVRHVGQDWWMG